jgi:hypothetical protein
MRTSAAGAAALDALPRAGNARCDRGELRSRAVDELARPSVRTHDAGHRGFQRQPGAGSPAGLS